MSQRLIRVYKNLDIQEIKKNLLIMGDLTAQCAQCLCLGVKIEAARCPQCDTEFRFMAFKNIKDHLPKILRLSSERPQLTIVDHDDFKRLIGALKAEEFLK